MTILSTKVDDFINYEKMVISPENKVLRELSQKKQLFLTCVYFLSIQMLLYLYKHNIGALMNDSMGGLEIENDDGSIGALQKELLKKELNDKTLEAVNELLSEEQSDISVNVNVKKNKPKVILGQFFIGFAENLLQLDLKPTEFKVVIYILKMMDYGNLVSLKQSTIAKDLGLDKSAVNRAWKVLITKKVLVDNNGHIYFNSNFCAKGLSSSLDKERIENLKRSNVSDENIKQMLNLCVR